jgi:hypothetical protein
MMLVLDGAPIDRVAAAALWAAFAAGGRHPAGVGRLVCVRATAEPLLAELGLPPLDKVPPLLPPEALLLSPAVPVLPPKAPPLLRPLVWPPSVPLAAPPVVELAAWARRLALSLALPRAASAAARISPRTS